MLALALAIALTSAAHSDERSAARSDGVDPRAIFFDDYFLNTAQQEVPSMDAAECSALRSLLEVCAGSLIVEEIKHLRCELSRQRYLLRYRQANRGIYRLLDAVQVFALQFRYNQAIGRESEAGIDARLRTIRDGLASAVTLAPPLARRGY